MDMPPDLSAYDMSHRAAEYRRAARLASLHRNASGDRTVIRQSSSRARGPRKEHTRRSAACRIEQHTARAQSAMRSNSTRMH
jgi:hypothetical protein